MGYARATMDAIAKAAGASRKTIYARYANKAEVLTAVVNRLLDTALAPHEAEPVRGPRRARSARTPAPDRARDLRASRPRPKSPVSTA